MADVELLPLPESLYRIGGTFDDPAWDDEQMREYARANMVPLLRERDSLRNRLEDTVRDLTDTRAENEWLRAEVERLLNINSAVCRRSNSHLIDAARWSARAGRLTEALRETTAALGRHFDGTCDGTEIRVALNARALLREQEDRNG